MNKLNITSIGLVLILFINNVLLANEKPFANCYNTVVFQIGDLKNKPYYDKIFTKDEIKELKKADKFIVSAKKYSESYQKDQLEIEKLFTIAEASSSAKSRDKSLKKARKLEEGSLKDGFKSLEYYAKATDIFARIYTNALGRSRLNDDSKIAKSGRGNEMKAKTLFEDAKDKENTAPEEADQLKFSILSEVNELNLKAIEHQEKAFAFYNNDPSVQTEILSDNISNTLVNKKIAKKDSILFPVYIEQYNPLKDENLNKSKSGIIFPRLKLTDEEINSITQINKKNQNANELLKKVDQTYVIVDSLNYEADRIEDKALQDKFRSQAIEKENTAFYNLILATRLFLEVNDTRYNIYKRHFPVIEAKNKTPETDRAKKFESEADKYYKKAKSEISQANKMVYKSDQYLKLMGANDLLLYSLQLQESAYGIYFNMPGWASAEIDSAFVESHKFTNETKSVKEENISNKLSWEVLASYSYSKDKPKPLAYKTKKGVVFLIQMGIFKGFLDPEKFGNIQPVIFDKFVKNPYSRYMAGEYRSSEAADLALEKIKALGYTDSYIISMIDGQRKSYSAGTAALNRSDEHYNFLKRTELARINGEKVLNNLVVVAEEEPKTGIISENKVQNYSGLLYFVQLGMYTKPITYKELANLNPIYTDNVPEKGIRYMLGAFKTIEKAREDNQMVVNKGLKDAYVIAYYNGENITLEKAINIEKAQKGVDNSNNKPENLIVFMVQVGAYRENLDSTKENQLYKTFSTHQIDKQLYKQMNLYTIGKYKTYKEAETLKKELLNSGHKDVFIVAFNGSEKITVSEAIKRNKN